jgi:predicted acylesterase/phospholipase RssA
MKVLICSILILLSFIALTNAKDASKCYGLALQGGGDKGAYQAGALQQIIEGSDASEIQYDVITGVSIGSINGALLAGYEKGQEVEAADFMVNTWLNLTQKDIYKDWSWGGVARGLLYEDALFDSSPFKAYIKGQLSPPKRHFFVSATDASTGAEKTWDETLPFDDLMTAIDASSSFPGFFSPVKFNGTMYYDGGVSFNVDIHNAVLKCRDNGFEDKDIVIDVLLCTGATFTDKNVSTYKTIPMTLRFYEIERYYESMELIERGMEDYYDVDFRYVVAPTEKLEPSIVPMAFKHKDIVHMIEQGKADAKQVMGFGHKIAADYLVEFTNLKKFNGYTEDYGRFIEKKESTKHHVSEIIE